MLYLIKKYPSPRFRVNPFINVDIKTGKIELDDDVRAATNKLELMLTHKFEDKTIATEEVIGDYVEDS